MVQDVTAKNTFGVGRTESSTLDRWILLVLKDNETAYRVCSPRSVKNTRFVDHRHCDNSGKKNTPKPWPGLPHTIQIWFFLNYLHRIADFSPSYFGPRFCILPNMYIRLYTSTVRNRHRRCYCHTCYSRLTQVRDRTYKMTFSLATVRLSPFLTDFQLWHA